MRTSKKEPKQVAREGLPDDPDDEQEKAAILATKPQPKRYLTAITLTPQQWAILDAMVTIRHRASEIGTRPLTRADRKSVV